MIGRCRLLGLGVWLLWALTLAPVPSHADPPTGGLIHWWPDPAEGTDAVTGRRGVRRGFGALLTDPEMRFGGSAGWMELGPGITNQDFTLSGWVHRMKPDFQGWTGVVISQDSGLGDGWAIMEMALPGGLVFASNAVGDPPVTTGLFELESRWQNLTVCVTTNRTAVWLDGQRVGQWSVPLKTSTRPGPLCVGNYSLGSGQWSGDIRDLRIYDRQLAASEIEELAGAPRSGPRPQPVESHVAPVEVTEIHRANPRDYDIRHFTTDDGLPSSEVQSLLQSRNGALWIGFEEGLVRYDGRQFELSDATAPGFLPSAADVMCIAERDTGDLWMGLFHGMASVHNGQWKAFTQLGDAAFVGRLATTESGAIWTASKRDSLPRGRFLLRRLEPETGRIEFEIPVPGQVRDLRPAGEKTVWIATDEPAALWRLDERDGSLIPVVQLSVDDGVPGQRVFPPPPCVRVRDESGRDQVGVRVWTDATGVIQWAEVSLHGQKGTLTWVRGENSSWRLNEVATGASLAGWVSTSRGLIHHNGQRWERVEMNTSVSDPGIRILAPNAEGGIWVGTSADGLRLIQPRLVKLADFGEGLPRSDVATVTRLADDRLLISFARGDVVKWDPTGLVPLQVGAPEYFGNSVAALPDGSIVGALRQSGDFGPRVRKGSSTVQYVLASSRMTFPGLNDVSQLHYARDGSVWLVSHRGAYQFHRFPDPRPIDLVRHLMPPDFTPWLMDLPREADLCGLAEDAKGGIWIGTFGNGLFCIRGTNVQHFTDPHPLRDNPCVPLGFGVDGTLWLGSQAGLGIWRDGAYHWVRPADGLPESVVCGVQEVGEHVWIAGRRGIHAIRRTNLEAFFAGRMARIESISIGRADGLPSTEVRLLQQPVMARTHEDTLAVATAAGLVHFRTSAALAALRPPPVAVEGLRVEGHPVNLRVGNRRLVLFPEQGRTVEVLFSSLSFISPERVTFHYVHSGPDGEFRGTNKQPYAVLPRLSPGRHQISVTARNANGMASESPARLEFDVAPRWHEMKPVRLWGSLGILFGVTAVVSTGVTRRLRRVRRLAALEQEQSLSAQRRRIAQDMHDELGASLARLAWQSRSGSTEEVISIPQVARELLRTLDETVWTINPGKDHLEGVVNYLGSWTSDFFAGTGTTLSLNLPALIPDVFIPSRWRHHLLLMVKEATTNVLKHARASRVELTVQLDSRDGPLRVLIRDDGIGFQRGTAGPDPQATPGGSVAPLGGNGSANLRRRASALGAELHIASEPGKGTEVSIIVPLP